MKHSKILFALMAGCFIIVACKDVDFKKTKGGMPYKLYPGKGTKKAAKGSFLKAAYTQKVNDSVLYKSYGKVPVYIAVTDATDPYSPTELFGELKVGDSLVTIQMVDTFIKRNPMMVPPPFKNGDRIISTFKILDILPDQAAYMNDLKKEEEALLQREQSRIQQYLQKNNINAVKTEKGVFVQVSNAGEGEPIDSGKYVMVKYRGKTFAGKVFDTNMDTSFHHTDPIGITIGQGGSIPGFEEGLKALKKGGRGVVYIPSMLAYGSSPPPGSNIPPFADLIFELEIVDVKNSAPPVVRVPLQQNVDTIQQHQ
ncbi:MAG: hypothetical protein C4308_12170 [Chitinophagaceae bacterium]